MNPWTHRIGLVKWQTRIRDPQYSGWDSACQRHQAIAANTWQHIVFRRGCRGRGKSIFINGSPSGQHDGPTTEATWNLTITGQVVYLWAQSSPVHLFFRAAWTNSPDRHYAMTDQEMRELYNYHERQLDETKTNPVKVDADLPTSAPGIGFDLLANAPQRLYVAAQDSTSSRPPCRVGRRHGSQASAGPAQRRRGRRGGQHLAAALCAGGEGAYTLYTRATDGVGNQETPGAGKTVYVDARPPIITFNAVTELIRPQASETEGAVWTLYLEGASHDPGIGGTSQLGSGVASIAVRLFDQNAETATLFDTQQAEIDPATGHWSLRYKLNVANPTGEYRATAIATDGVGNQTEAAPIVIRIDTTAPRPRSPSSPHPTRKVAPPAAAFPGILGKDGMISGVVTEAPTDVVSQTQVAGVSGVELAFAPLFTHGATFRNTQLPATTVLYLPLDESQPRRQPRSALRRCVTCRTRARHPAPGRLSTGGGRGQNGPGPGLRRRGRCADADPYTPPPMVSPTTSPSRPGSSRMGCWVSAALSARPAPIATPASAWAPSAAK